MRARLLLAAAVLTLAGCSHYQLGTEGKLAFSSIFVAPVEDKALIPQAQAAVSVALRDAFAKDGRVTLAENEGDADAVLTVVLTRYYRQGIASRESDTGLASKFAIYLDASCTLRDPRTGKAYFANRTVEVERDVYTDNGDPSSPLYGNQLQAEYDILPLLAESLGEKVGHTVLDVW